MLCQLSKKQLFSILGSRAAEIRWCVWWFSWSIDCPCLLTVIWYVRLAWYDLAGAVSIAVPLHKLYRLCTSSGSAERVTHGCPLWNSVAPSLWLEGLAQPPIQAPLFRLEIKVWFSSQSRCWAIERSTGHHFSRSAVPASTYALHQDVLRCAHCQLSIFFIGAFQLKLNHCTSTRRLHMSVTIMVQILPVYSVTCSIDQGAAAVLTKLLSQRCTCDLLKKEVKYYSDMQY